MNTQSYRKYLLFVLPLILAFNLVDRAVLSLVMQDIKVELALADTQLGLLTGVAFGLFYSIMGIPIARWADRGNRITIISLTTALWSVAVTLFGVAASFVQLLLIRVGMGVGEAGCIPPALSLIADHFRRPDRSRAVAIYMLGGPLGMILGYFLAGWINELYGWRLTFILLGLPGLALALLAKLTLREPRLSRAVSCAELATATNPTTNTIPALGEALTTLWSNRTFRHLLFSHVVLYLCANCVANWQPTFFIRSYGLGTGEVGTWYALAWGVGGATGTYLGGVLAARYMGGNERRQLQALGFVFFLFTFGNTFIYLAPTKDIAMGILMISAVIYTCANAPLYAVIQTLVPERMRALSIAIVYLFSNLIGMGLGPLLIGAVSDMLAPVFGQESLRYALLAVSPGYFWVAWHLRRASRTISRDLKVAELAHSGDRLKESRPTSSVRRAYLEVTTPVVEAGEAASRTGP